ncbi:4389_t:CDS:2 [Ambispora leptoticha]|uniref:4389_t:CDS:1 n=1 Tax=Ambispora leptoticha TaxID=144679 RepID=A0A9N9GX98_9GLOM|nr:4389_t:CDS:2 [Ambispora leptoticha]
MISKLNKCVASSQFGRYFKLENSGAKKSRENTKFTTELRAGVATFITMAYILSVNATIIADSGGPCECKTYTESDTFPCMNDEEYAKCVMIVKKDLITATAAISCICTAIFGLLANLPFALAPGMGINAYFAYTMVGKHGSGKLTYGTALSVVFMEGILLFILSLLGIRQKLAKLVPMSIRAAIGVGIGLFLTITSFQKSSGIGLISYDPKSLLTLGGCPDKYYNSDGSCDGHYLESGTTWLGILGFFIIQIMAMYQVKGAILFGILFVSIISWIRNSPITYFPDTPEGAIVFDYKNKDVWIALSTLLCVDILDTTAGLYYISKFAGLDKQNGDFKGSKFAFFCDAISISLSAIFGSSPTTVYIESCVGIAEGGRTGITALATSICFFISLFFAPLFASFPPWATGPALLILGVMMTSSVKDINWIYPGDAVPAFLTIAVIPFSMNISYGTIAGISTYILINGFVWVLETVSRGKISPPEKNLKEPFLDKLDNSGAINQRQNSKFTTELRAGILTFVTMAFILSVIAVFVADSGGPCVCKLPVYVNISVETLCFNYPDYTSCITTVKKDMITATAATSCLASGLMGLFANLPFGLATGW